VVFAGLYDNLSGPLLRGNAAAEAWRYIVHLVGATGSAKQGSDRLWAYLDEVLRCLETPIEDALAAADDPKKRQTEPVLHAMDSQQLQLHIVVGVLAIAVSGRGCSLLAGAGLYVTPAVTE
jgi:hypothetical protein